MKFQFYPATGPFSLQEFQQLDGSFVVPADTSVFVGKIMIEPQRKILSEKPQDPTSWSPS